MLEDRRSLTTESEFPYIRPFFFQQVRDDFGKFIFLLHVDPSLAPNEGAVLRHGL